MWLRMEVVSNLTPPVETLTRGPVTQQASWGGWVAPTKQRTAPWGSTQPSGPSSHQRIMQVRPTRAQGPENPDPCPSEQTEDPSPGS